MVPLAATAIVTTAAAAAAANTPHAGAAPWPPIRVIESASLPSARRRHRALERLLHALGRDGVGVLAQSLGIRRPGRAAGYAAQCGGDRRDVVGAYDLPAAGLGDDPAGLGPNCEREDRSPGGEVLEQLQVGELAAPRR